MNSKNLVGTAFAEAGAFYMKEYITMDQSVGDLNILMFTHPWNVCIELRREVSVEEAVSRTVDTSVFLPTLS